MTQKELLYVEDAIMHEKSIMSIIDESIKNIDDESLVEFMNNELDKQKLNLDNLMNLLEDKNNG